MHSGITKLLSQCLVLFFVSTRLNAQYHPNTQAAPNGAPLVKAVRITTPPIIDGVIDENTEWKGVATFDGLVDQLTGGPSPETAHFWLAYDREFIYFAARLDDSKPDQIKAVEYRSNVPITGEDTVALTIDLSGSLADFSTFTINPKGATTLAIAGGRAAKREWLGEFQAKARITSTGWEAEAKIPWKILPVPGKGKRSARFNVTRYIARLQETYTYTYTGSNKNALTPIWSDVEMPQGSNVRKLLMLPYGYAGYDKDNGGIGDAGLDVKAPLTETINMVGTISPDFRNLENQLLSLDFSRFERLVPESRPFFLEGANYYASQITASQRVGNFDTGLNVYGKADDKTSFGLLDAIDFGNENDFILNTKRQFDAATNLKLTATSKRAFGNDNEAYCALVVKNYGPYSLSAKVAGSLDSQLGNGLATGIGSQYYYKGWTGYFFHETTTENFNPALGFEPETDYKGSEGGTTYTKTFTKGPFLGYGFNADFLEYEHMDGSFYRRDWDLAGNVTLHSGVKAIYVHDRADFEGQKDLFDGLTVYYPSTNPYRNVSIGSDWGTQALLPYHTVRIKGAYRTLGKLDLSLSYQGVDYQGFNDQVILTGNYDMGRNRAISGRIVKQGSQIDPYIAFRRSGNSGAEYFLILGNPNTTQFKTAVVLKVTFPLEKIIGR